MQTKFAKVMFLHVCVCPGGGGAWSSGGAWFQGGDCCGGWCLVLGVPGPRGAAWSRVVGGGGVETPLGMATAAGSTHPTGMHPCF